MRPSISFGLPPPSTSVVLSLSTETPSWRRREFDVLQILMAEILGDGFAALQDGDVLVASPCGGRRTRRFHAAVVPVRGSCVVETSGGQRLALYLFGDDEQGLSRVVDCLSNAGHVLPS